MKPPSIIVIGASEGGLQALGTVLGALPAGFPASVLIVLHMHPNSPMQLAEILERHGSLPVSYAHSAASISLGHVYLAPPDHHLTIDPDGRLHLNKGPKEHHTRPRCRPPLSFSRGGVWRTGDWDCSDRRRRRRRSGPAGHQGT